MSKIMRFTSDKSGYMLGQKDGGWVRYQDHLAEVERLTVERDNAQAGDDVALSALTSALRERDAAQAEVERLIGERVAAQAETKRLIDRLAWAEARVDEDAETGRTAAERDAARAEVEMLRAKLHELGHKLETAQIKLMTWHEGTSLDPAVQLRADVARLTTERDAARAEIERLTQELEGRRATNQRVMAERDAAQREVERLQIMLKCERDEVAQLRDRLRVLRANGQAMLDTSRPPDEDIWREAFMRQLHDPFAKNWTDTADSALAEYRKRWPR